MRQTAKTAYLCALAVRTMRRPSLAEVTVWAWVAVCLLVKRTGARWKVEHVGPLVEMIALSETPEWDAVWTAA